MGNEEKSILNTTKAALGLPAGYTPFDAEVLMHLNSAISTLTQLGVGPEEGYIVVDHRNNWDELLGDDKTLEFTKTYIHLMVKRNFDPPENGSILMGIEKQLAALEWRIEVAVTETRRRAEENSDA